MKKDAKSKLLRPTKLIHLNSQLPESYIQPADEEILPDHDQEDVSNTLEFE